MRQGVIAVANYYRYIAGWYKKWGWLWVIDRWEWKSKRWESSVLSGDYGYKFLVWDNGYNTGAHGYKPYWEIDYAQPSRARRRQVGFVK